MKLSNSNLPAPVDKRVPLTLFVFIVALLYLLKDACTISPDLQVPDARKWQWTDIKPSRNLTWHSCYDGFQCARLDVPMDWLDPKDDERVVIAVLKYPAAEREEYKGALFTNPGGPAVSGVEFLLQAATAIHKIVGTNHDLISFDPRGVGATTPHIHCSPPNRPAIFNLKNVLDIDSHPGMIYDNYAISYAQSQSCIRNAGEIIKYVSTTSVARDMLEIMKQEGHEMLNYWGISYGTVLGGIFASMYPDRVGRLIGDGNVDLKEWTSLTHRRAWKDTDEIYTTFIEMCRDAGPKKCAIHDDSLFVIAMRVDAVQQSLRTHPVIVYDETDSGTTTDIITYTAFSRLIGLVLDQPVYRFSLFADIVAALEKGDGQPAMQFFKQFGQYEADSGCPTIGELPDQIPSRGVDAFRAIGCTDGGGLNETVEEFKKYADDLMVISRSLGAFAALFRMSCVGWTQGAKLAFTGPFVAQTAHPILLINNRLDPVTPLESAQENAKGFKDSVVLVQNSLGHSTLSAPSLCTGKYIRAYFQEGTLPPKGTVCEADIQPFELEAIEHSVTGDDILEGQRELSRLQRNLAFLR